MPLEESSIAWKYQHNTLIVGYDKPEKILELERKKQLEIAQLVKQGGINQITPQAPTPIAGLPAIGGITGINRSNAPPSMAGDAESCK